MQVFFSNYRTPWIVLLEHFVLIQAVIQQYRAVSINQLLFRIYHRAVGVAILYVGVSEPEVPEKVASCYGLWDL